MCCACVESVSNAGGEGGGDSGAGGDCGATGVSGAGDVVYEECPGEAGGLGRLPSHHPLHLEQVQRCEFVCHHNRNHVQHHHHQHHKNFQDVHDHIYHSFLPHQYINTSIFREFSLLALVLATSVFSLFPPVGCSLRSPLTTAGSQVTVMMMVVQ